LTISNHPKGIDELLQIAVKVKDVKLLGIGSDFFYTGNNNDLGKLKKIEKNKDSPQTSVLLRKFLDKGTTLNSLFPKILLIGTQFIKPKPYYVHSKIWVFDDELIIIGSANYWARSFHAEFGQPMSEFGVAITSTKNGKDFGFPNVSYARGLRLKLWERFRKEIEPSFSFPNDAKAANLTFEQEFLELIKNIKTPLFVFP
jgi:phosphatidylserine/phosphatidylglycerophosphate/cardiolipin synthase-like enzyme